MAPDEGATPQRDTQTAVDSLPPVVYLPTRSADPDSPEGEAFPELRRLEDGRLALPAYSALDRLVDGCGEAQPWVLVPVDAVEVVCTSSDCDVVLLDVPLPTELRRVCPEGRRPET
jgi:hypothetical protein